MTAYTCDYLHPSSHLSRACCVTDSMSARERIVLVELSPSIDDCSTSLATHSIIEQFHLSVGPFAILRAAFNRIPVDSLMETLISSAAAYATSKFSNITPDDLSIELTEDLWRASDRREVSFVEDKPFW